MKNSIGTEIDSDRGRSCLALNDGEHLGSRFGSSPPPPPSLRSFKGRSLSQSTKRDEVRASRRAPESMEASRIYTIAMNSVDSRLKESQTTSSYKISIDVGLSEECCLTPLPGVIALFERYNPSFSIKMYSHTYGLLVDAIKPPARLLDLILCPRGKGSYDSEVFWEDKLIWIRKPGVAVADDRPIDLIVPDSRIPTRYEPMGALTRADRKFRVRLESGNHGGLEAALCAGLGVGVGFDRIRLFKGVEELLPSCGLPELPQVQFVMAGLEPSSSEGMRRFAAFLKAAALWSFESLTGVPSENG